MKLFAKYNRVNIAATILAFVFGSIVFYFVLHYVLIRQLDQGLRVEQQEVVNYVTAHDRLPDIQNTRHQWIQVEPATAPIEKVKPRSVQAYNRSEDEKESIRQLTFSLTAAGKLYHITVNQSETETEDLLQLIILVTVGMIGIILLSNYIINRAVVGRLWQPFYTTIDKIKDYDLSSQQPLRLAKEPIDEINLLNENLNRMTERIHQAYQALRSFTENASHEMQTPLAVIRSKVEALLQETEGKEKNIQQLLAIEDATQKLSKLHQSLLLLTKLGNRQFLLNEPVNFAEIIRIKLEERQELVASRNLVFHISCEEVVLAFHRHLAEILVNNLLNNVIRYTPAGGDVTIDLTTRSLSIKNTTTNGPLNGDKIFQRFYKEDQSGEGTGLGLAIVKEICIIAGFRIEYRYTDNMHDFIIYFTS
jgi:two-component system sensor histidine kinase QseC